MKTSKIRLDRIDLNDEQWELKKIKKLQENMSYKKLSGNNLDKYLHHTLTTRIGIKIKKADNDENNKKLSKISSEGAIPKQTALSKKLDEF